MRPQSAKAKGRRLQQHVAQEIITQLGIPKEDVKSTPMGSQGSDVWLSSQAAAQCPFSFECKNTESLNIWKAIKQAEANVGIELWPAVVFARNRQEPYVAIPFEALMQLLKDSKGEAGK